MDELPEGWSSHKAPTGHTYYYHAASKKSTYKRPTKEVEVLSRSEAPAIAPKFAPDNLHALKDRPDDSSEIAKNTLSTQATGQTRQHRTTDRPKHKEEIPNGDPWVQVRTKHGRVFYHNRTSLESIWDVPQEIREAVRLWEQAKSRIRVRESEDYSDEFRSPEEENAEAEETSEVEYLPEVLETAEPVEFNEDDIALQLAAMQEAGEGPIPDIDDDGSEFTQEQKAEIFRQMLVDKDVDAFSTWDSQLGKITSDPRYLIFDTTHQRKQIFEDYCATKAKELRDLKAVTVQVPPQVVFLRFLKQHAKKGQYFVDFKRKHKKDAAFRSFGNADHEREKLFRTYQDHNKLDHVQKEADFISLITSGVSDLESDVRYHVLTDDQMQPLLARFRKN